MILSSDKKVGTVNKGNASEVKVLPPWKYHGGVKGVIKIGPCIFDETTTWWSVERIQKCRTS